MSKPTAVRLVGPAIAAVLALAALAAPSTALGTDPDPTGPPVDETPTVVPHSTEAPTDGEIVYDGPFVEPTDDASPGADQVRGGTEAPGRPAVTPPATDALPVAAPGPARGDPDLLLAALLGIAGATVASGRAARAGRR